MPAELQDEQLPLQPEQPQEQLPLFFRIVRMAKPTATAMANNIKISQIFIEPSLLKQNLFWSYYMRENGKMQCGGYKLAAIDMDGTLLMSDKRVHPDTVRDLADAAERGIELVYCSGRAIPELEPYRKILPMIRYAVCMSGAVVYDFADGRSIHCRPVPQQLVDRIVDTAEKYGGMLNILTDEESIVSANDLTHLEDFLMEPYGPLYEKVAKKVQSMAEEAKKQKTIAKINIYFRSAEDRLAGYGLLKELPLTFAFAEGASLEITAGGVTKADGLGILCRHLGIPMEETLGIGDADNDRAVLETVGLAVAMGNAEPKILAICDAVTADNDHNGVGAAGRRYC